MSAVKFIFLFDGRTSMDRVNSLLLVQYNKISMIVEK